MQELIYLLTVPKAAQAALARRLGLGEAPSHVRVATIAPLSNYGYGESSHGALLVLDAQGLVFGDETDEGVPRAFVPWSNVAYIADGTQLARRQEEVALTEKPGAQPVLIQRSPKRV